MEETKFYPMAQMPVPDESDASFSRTVIVYGEKVNDAGLGYFDFEINQWLHLSKNTFLLKCWCYIPDHINVIKSNDWAIVVPKGYQRSFFKD